MNVRRLTPRMIEAFCNVRLRSLLSSDEVERFRLYADELLAARHFPPYRGKWVDVPAIAARSGIDEMVLDNAGAAIQPLLDALSRAATAYHTSKTSTPLTQRQSFVVASTALTTKEDTRPRTKRALRRLLIVEFPEPLWSGWDDVAGFSEALNLHARRHGEGLVRIFKSVVRDEDGFYESTLAKWLHGTAYPRSIKSLEILARIERRYRLPEGYFRDKLPNQSRAAYGHAPINVSPAERRRLAWHLPDDFARRPIEEQQEIVAWVRSVIINGSTDFREFQAAASKQRFAVRFPEEKASRRRRSYDDDDEPVVSTVIDAPPDLQREMKELLRFKMSTLTAFGLQRNGVWGSETASQKVEHFGLLFGALAASPLSAVAGLGVDPKSLTFALLVVPAVWDWYLQWRERRRGFYTAWEVDMLSVALSLLRKETGWLRQSPALAQRLSPIGGLLSTAEIAAMGADWEHACDVMHKHAGRRVKEIKRVARVHRDPFEPILPILEAKSPVGEYRKITHEIIRRVPDERIYPRPAAEVVRSFLLLRFGLHLGLRQKNLRQLLLCSPGLLPTSERRLEDMKCGELRWSAKEAGWEVFIPCAAFKNATSSFFGSQPFRLLLPDLDGLNALIDAYVSRHRGRLLGLAKDPGTFFVKTTKSRTANAAYDQNTFYEALRLTVQRYGIFNPYTGRGAIVGLLPHGPHNVRDVLATHVLKQTGSYEQASTTLADRFRRHLRGASHNAGIALVVVARRGRGWLA